MKTLFRESIQDERERLVRALSAIPLNSAQAIQSARTHITFKAPIQPNDLKAESDTNHITATSDRPSKAERKSRPWLLALTVALIGVVSALLLIRRTPELPHEEGSPIVTPTPETPAPLPSSLESPSPEASVESPQPIIDFPSPVPVIKQPGHTIREILKPNLGTPPKATQAPETPAPIKEAPRPKKVAQGTIDVVAPPEGFAKLMIDGKILGTVPGPKARGILVDEGTHIIRCETASKVYAGRLRIKENDHKVIQCKDLKP